MNIFTDGACSHNGSSKAIAGMGIFISDNHPKNLSERVTGKQTNNVAELSAVIKVFSLFKNEIERGEDIMIYTDSEYVLKCCGYFGEKSQKNQWKHKKGWIANHELVREIYELYHQFPNVNVKHIKAHTGKDDELSKGNEQADKLANIAIGKLPTKRIYLNVPYERKDEAKQLGAKWNPQKKKWYTESQENTDTLVSLFGISE
jgi:ribonuclease HI